ncbi:MAG: glycosyltransferase family 61 protein [Acidocella sp.]|nr:glycosyltransferase family 61 protein [Acidocella sp.]
MIIPTLSQEHQFGTQYNWSYFDEIGKIEKLEKRISKFEFTTFNVDVSSHGFENREIVLPKPNNSDTWDIGQYPTFRPCIYRLSDCIIHTGYGLVTIDGYLAKETTSHFPLHYFENSIFKNGTSSWNIVNEAQPQNVDFALSCHHGIPDNYYHWLVLFLPKLYTAFLYTRYVKMEKTPAILFPPISQEYQILSAKSLAKYLKFPHFILEKFSKIHVNELFYPEPIGGIGLNPNYTVLETFRILRDLLVIRGYSGPKKIFISRSDTGRRKLSNENELADALFKRGFSTIILSNLSFREQISLFAQADVIVGQHGAGLTNIGFCQRDAKLLELHNPSYQNYCYRRLSALCGVEYDLVFGNEDETTQGLHPDQLTMSVPIEEVLGLLDRIKW